MRKVKLYIACSLDGKIARPNGAIDWLPDPSEQDYGYNEFYNSLDATLMGYKTYEVCRAFGDWVYPDKKTYVFSHNPDRKLVPEAELVTTDPSTFVAELKTKPGKDIWVIGGGQIISLLHDAQLIDQYVIAIIPVILGEGLELFPSIRKQVNLTLQKHIIYPNGVALFYYDTKN
jgi:Dihydrofolate reductase